MARRNPDQKLTTRGETSRITTFRMPYDLEAALKECAVERGQPWQAVMKDILYDALGMRKTSAAEVKRTPARLLHAATHRLKRRP